MQKELIMRCLPTAFCHASTVLALPDGSLLCCWFGGTHEGESDVGIYLSRRTDAGWSEPKLLVNGAAANWNPVLFAGADARKQGRKGLVLTCKDRLVHYYAKFGFADEGVSDKSTHGNAVWHQMRLTF